MVQGECAGCGYPHMDDEFSDAWGSLGPDILSSDDYMDEDMDSVPEEDLDTDSDPGSLNGFVINEDRAGRPSPRISGRHWFTSNAESDIDATAMDGRSETVSEPDLHDAGRASSSEPDQLDGRSRASEETAISSTAQPPSHRRPIIWESDSSDDESSNDSETSRHTSEHQVSSRYNSDHHTSSITVREDGQSDESEAPVQGTSSSTRARSRPPRPDHEAPRSGRLDTILISSDSEDEPIPIRATRRSRALRNRPAPGENEVIPRQTPARHQQNPPVSPQNPEPVSSFNSGPNRRTAVSARASQRENLHMPGAFPPSFTFSENGGASQVPRTGDASLDSFQPNRLALTSAHQDPQSRPSRSPSDSAQGPSRGPQTRSREVDKAAHRANRQRIKAEVNARRQAHARAPDS